jgi:hypothetical protein
VLTYDKDYGVKDYKSGIPLIKWANDWWIEHNGDTEKVQLVLEYLYNPCEMELWTLPSTLIVKRHGYDESYYSWSEVTKKK